MKVKLINYTHDALNFLIYTKSTRLKADQTLGGIRVMPMEWKLDQLSYMRHTIKSSWEFVTYVFEITGVSRNFTHQFVRTRTQSYAQESLRTVDASEHKFLHYGEESLIYDVAIRNAKEAYKELLNLGYDVQYARGVLPSDILTSIIVKSDLRTLHETAKSRLCVRTQGEYQDVFKAMKAEVLSIHPWADDFINVACVDNGVCIFPNYKKCPIQNNTLSFNGYRKNIIKAAWEKNNHVANPVSRDGKTM